MASIHREILINANVDQVWDALRDFSALHTRLAPGFIADVRMDGEDRIVTFASGAVLREVPLGVDDEQRRLAWSIVDGPYTHHNGAAQVFAEGDDQTRFVWVCDLLPDELAERTAQAMETGLRAIKETQEAAAPRSRA